MYDRIADRRSTDPCPVRSYHERADGAIEERASRSIFSHVARCSQKYATSPIARTRHRASEDARSRIVFAILPIAVYRLISLENDAARARSEKSAVRSAFRSHHSRENRSWYVCTKDSSILDHIVGGNSYESNKYPDLYVYSVNRKV